MTKPFIGSLFVNNFTLFNLIYKFNNDLSEYADSNHIEALAIFKYWEKIKGSKRGRKKCSSYLKKVFDLEKGVYDEFKEPFLRLALLDVKVLTKLMLYAGAGRYSEGIGKIVVNKQVLALKEAIGNDVYFFSEKRAPLLKGTMPRASTDETTGEITRDRCLKAGKACLEMCFAKEDSAILKRLTLKFPATHEWDFNSEAKVSQKTTAWNYLQRIISKEMKTVWKVCFT